MGMLAKALALVREAVPMMQLRMRSLDMAMMMMMMRGREKGVLMCTSGELGNN
jgi:hypothetical protein